MSTTATKDKTETAIPGVKQDIINIAAAIKKDMTLDAKTGVITVNKDLYERLLPEGLTKDTIELVQQHNTEFAAAAGLAIGEVAIPAMKKHKELERVSVSIPTVQKDAFNLNFDRSRQVPDRNAEGGGTKTKFGSLGVEFQMYGAKSRGQLGKVKEHLSSLALDALGK
jgi:hypothetical protein